MEAPNKMAEWEFELLAMPNGDIKYLYGEYLKVFEYIEDLEKELRLLPKEWDVRELERKVEETNRMNQALKSLVKEQGNLIREALS